MFMLVIAYRDIKTNERQFEELRLQYAVDYAVEAAFASALEGGNLEISYQDLQNVKINPSNVLDVFKSVLALSYDMSLSEENLEQMDLYISSAVLAVADGYYIATLQEVDTGRLSPQRGGEYQLRWGLKKPYAIPYTGVTMTRDGQIPDKYISFNLSTDQWILARQNGNDLELRRGENFTELSLLYGIAPSREEIIARINQMIMDDINYHIRERNAFYSRHHSRDFVYLPAQVNAEGVNPIQKPSLFITLSNVDFAGTQKLNIRSVGGYTLAKKKRVLAFVKDGVKYYCYESQLPESELHLVERFFNSIDEAALAGYRPHVDYLRKPLSL